MSSPKILRTGSIMFFLTVSGFRVINHRQMFPFCFSAGISRKLCHYWNINLYYKKNRFFLINSELFSKFLHAKQFYCGKFGEYFTYLLLYVRILIYFVGQRTMLHLTGKNFLYYIFFIFLKFLKESVKNILHCKLFYFT